MQIKTPPPPRSSLVYRKRPLFGRGNLWTRHQQPLILVYWCDGQTKFLKGVGATRHGWLACFDFESKFRSSAKWLTHESQCAYSDCVVWLVLVQSRWGTLPAVAAAELGNDSILGKKAWTGLVTWLRDRNIFGIANKYQFIRGSWISEQHSLIWNQRNIGEKEVKIAKLIS